jgi:hypothetical protein
LRLKRHLVNHNARLPRCVLSRRDFIALAVAAAAALTFPGCQKDEARQAGDTEAEDAVDSSLDAATRAAIIDDLLPLLKEKYVFLDVAGMMEEDVRERQSNGEYDGITDRAAFADTLTNNLQEVSHDEHLEVTPKSIDEAGPPGPPPATSEEDPSGFLYRAEHLPGGVGYMDLRVFASPQSGAGDAAASAMNELNDTGTLIFETSHRTWVATLRWSHCCTVTYSVPSRVPSRFTSTTFAGAVETISRLRNSGHNPRWKGSVIERTSQSIF